MSIPFHNNTGNTKFTGEIFVADIPYEYILYLLPAEGDDINNIQKREIVQYFGNRMFFLNGKWSICLGVDANTIRRYLRNRDISAYVRVKTAGFDNEASGTIQISDHCNLGEPDIWINDVCRVGTVREGDPVKVMFLLIEQLAAQNMNKTNMKLCVERKPEKNLAVLTKKYKDFGFSKNDDMNPDICPGAKYKHRELVMEKTGLVPAPELIDFSFLLSSSSETNEIEIPVSSHKKRRTKYGGRKRVSHKLKTRKSKSH